MKHCSVGDFDDEQIKMVVDHFVNLSDENATISCTGKLDRKLPVSVDWFITVKPKVDKEKSVQDVMAMTKETLVYLAYRVFYFTDIDFCNELLLDFVDLIITKAVKNASVLKCRPIGVFYGSSRFRETITEYRDCADFMEEFAVYRVCLKINQFVGANGKSLLAKTDQQYQWVDELLRSRVSHERIQLLLDFLGSDMKLQETVAAFYAAGSSKKVASAPPESKAEVSSVDLELAQPLTAQAPKIDDRMHQLVGLVGFFENLLRATPYAFKYRYDPITNKFNFERVESDDEEYDTVMDRINANQ